MTQRHSFDRGYLKQEFDKLDAIAKESMTLYLIGGGTMAFYGLKVPQKTQTSYSALKKNYST